jgi:hypothetical protein
MDMYKRNLIYVLIRSGGGVFIILNDIPIRHN